MSSVLLYIKKTYILASNASSFFLVAGVIWPSSGTGCSFPLLLLLLVVGSLELKHEIAVVPCPHVRACCPEVGSHGSSAGRAQGWLVEGPCFQEKHVRGGMAKVSRVKGQVLRSAPRWAVWPTDRQPTHIAYSVTGQRARLSPAASAEQIVAVGYCSLSWTPRPLCWQQKGWVFMGCSPLWGSP